jgi:hypothetical protein
MIDESWILEKKTPHYKEIIIRLSKFVKLVVLVLKTFESSLKTKV